MSPPESKQYRGRACPELVLRKLKEMLKDPPVHSPRGRALTNSEETESSKESANISVCPRPYFGCRFQYLLDKDRTR
jgi:hypothetical protein